MAKEPRFEQPSARQETSEEEEDSLEISVSEGSAFVSFHDLELSAESPTSSEIQIVVEKQPIDLVEGRSYADFSVLMDRETEKMVDLGAKAEALLELPEKERPAIILKILRSRVHYAYNEVIQKLSETDPELARWVAENIGLNSSVLNIPLSEIIEKGYGVCGHLATAYLWLAEKAGLKGVILSSNQGTIKNIRRSDTGEKLFESVEIGQPVSAHSWVEIITSDGVWIPVDPSTKLIGDSRDGLAIFKDANYMSSAHLSLDGETEPRDKLSPKWTPMLFAPAEATASGTCSLELRSTKSILRFHEKDLPPTNIPYSGEGKLQINRDEQSGGMSLDIIEVKKM